MLPSFGCDAGVLVVSTVAGTLDTRDGGLAAGDVIYAVNRKPVRASAELRTALEGAEDRRSRRAAASSGAAS